MKPRGLATLIGSFPNVDPDRALRSILEAVPEAPVWPQLPNRDWREGFLPQYSEGLPGRIAQPDKGKVFFDTKADLSAELTAFYEAALGAPETGDFSLFEISPEASAGLPAALEVFAALGSRPPYIKVHTTGALSFSLTVFDRAGTPLYFDDTFADLTVQSAALKSRWQVRLFRPHADRIICFLDEPALSAFGSSCYQNVTRNDVVDRLGRVVRAVQEEGALVGVHVCGNSEWTLLIDAGVDIISFDAFGYGESIALYAPAVRPFLEGGGVIAWGIVPTSAEIHNHDAASLDEKLGHLVHHLSGHDVDRELIWQQSMLTPTCGMGTMTVDDSELVMRRLGELAARVQARIRND
ncbi:MAG: hypothetical protein ABI333_18790 [bacterium]